MKDKFKTEVWAKIADPATICDRLRGIYRTPITDGLELCEDEGCPQHGTPHVCVAAQPEPDSMHATGYEEAGV